MGKQIKTLTVALLVVMTIGMCASAYAITYDEASSKLVELTRTSGFIPGTGDSIYGAQGCWRFVSAVCKKLHGTSCPGDVSGYNMAALGKWKRIGQYAGRNASAINVINMLKSACPGDVIQYKSQTTRPQHTAMVYGLSPNGLTVYDFAYGRGIGLNTYGWSMLPTNDGMGDFTLDTTYGISLYRAGNYSIPMAKCTIAPLANQVYTGEPQMPAVLIRFGIDNVYKLSADVDYSVAYNNYIKPGVCTVTVTGRNGFFGSRNASFQILPKRMSITSTKRKLLIHAEILWIRDSSVTGYEIQHSKKSSFSPSKIEKIAKNTTTSKTIFIGLGTEYIRIRSYVVDTSSKKTVYGEWSPVKTV